MKPGFRGFRSSSSVSRIARTFACAAIAVFVTISSSSAQVVSASEHPEAATSSWSGSLDAALRYVTWTGTRGDGSSVPQKGSGDQTYLPMSLSLSSASGNFIIDGLVRGGLVWSNQSTALLSGSVSTATDTVVSATLTDVGIDGVQPFASLNLNLPTGKPVLFGLSANGRMDPDIV